MTMGSFLCLPAWGTFLRSSSLLCFVSSRTDKCMGNGGPGLMEYSATTGRLGLGLLGLEGEALGLVLSWHGTATINSSWALGDNRFGPIRLAKRSTASFLGTAVTTSWLTALACNAGGRKILAKCQGTYWRARPRARARLPGEFPLRKYPRNRVFVDEEGYPYFVRTGLLLFLLRSRSPLALTRDAWRRKRANLDNFLLINPQRPMVLRQALPGFGLDNLLNGVILPS